MAAPEAWRLSGGSSSALSLSAWPTVCSRWLSDDLQVTCTPEGGGWERPLSRCFLSWLCTPPTLSVGSLSGKVAQVSRPERAELKRDLAIHLGRTKGFVKPCAELSKGVWCKEDSPFFL